MKIAIILGTRPEIIKLASVIRACQQAGHDFFILHTNQHYSANMDQVFFQELELPQPKYNLEIKAAQHGEMTGKMLLAMEPILMVEKPDWVIVQGDTNTVLAGAMTAAKLNIPIAHVEAGLRSYDRTMPEEINRILTDHVSSALFSPTQKQADILKGEGIESDKIYIVGNTIVDAVYQNQELVDKHPELNHYKQEKYILLTSHRPANVDHPESLKSLLGGVATVAQEYGFKVYFPIHPRTRKNITTFGIELDPNIFVLMEPVGYLEMLALEKNAQLIMTDSGGVQEEACILRVPSVTLRENTERPETVEVGANVLVGTDSEKIVAGAKKMMSAEKNWNNPFGSGESGRLIINLLS